MLKVIYYLGLFTFLVFNSLVCSSWAAQFTDGLVVYLPFDEGTGQKTKDASGNKHDGILEGPFKWDKGKFGQSLRFTSGKGTWVKVEDTKMLNVDVFTFMAWVNVEDWNGIKQIVGKSVHGGCGGRDQYGLFSEGGNMKLRLETEKGRHDVTAEIPETKKWVHLTCFNDGKEAKIFYDGKEVVKGNTPGKLKVSDAPWAIGQDCERLNYVPTGLIDEVRLWNRVLEEKEIGTYMKMGAKEALAVNLEAKLSVVWANVRTQF